MEKYINFYCTLAKCIKILDNNYHLYQCISQFFFTYNKNNETVLMFIFNLLNIVVFFLIIRF
jgi:hypothetical protein